jgi:cellulose synthase/poly-beta-1,6-N-acetylglucosamine synthase-like glycosyltransferase
MTWRVTVLMTAHDAADTIAATLRALADQELAADTVVDVVVVDDRSTDDTWERARLHAPHGSRILRVETLPQENVTARQAALDIGAGAADGDALLLLDADAMPPRDWIERMRRELRDADLVSWPLGFRATGVTWSARTLAMLQTADAAFYRSACRLVRAGGFASGVCFGAAGWRTTLQRRVGGFRGLGFSLTEDLEFARAAHRAGARVSFPRGDAVTVAAAPTLDAILDRALRVTMTGGVSTLSLTLGMWLATFPGVVLLTAAGWISPWWIAARWAAGMVVVLAGLRRAGGLGAWPAAIAYETCAVLAAVAVFWRGRHVRHVDWGGTAYPRHAPSHSARAALQPALRSAARAEARHP